MFADPACRKALVEEENSSKGLTKTAVCIAIIVS
uniref:Uncharacterized protein n=1 Tax=Arundo donax TaxID=35708 RepID=A0A0A9B451_ARUDO